MRSFWKNTAGNVGLLFGIGLPLVATSAAVAVQYSQLASRRSALQQAADSGAIAAAQQLKLANASDSVVASVASSTVQANVVTISDPISVQTQVLQKRTGVTVTVSDTVPLSWGKVIGISSKTIKASSTAQLYGPAGKLCMLSLDVKQSGTLHLQKQAQVTAKDCVIYSNSIDKGGLQADAGTGVTASFILLGRWSKDKRSNRQSDPDDGLPLHGRSPRLASAAGRRQLWQPSHDGDHRSASFVPRELLRWVDHQGNGSGNPHPWRLRHEQWTTYSPGFSHPHRAVRWRILHRERRRPALRSEYDDFDDRAKGRCHGRLPFFEDRSVSSPVLPPIGPLGAPPPPPYGSQPMRQYQISSNNASQFLGTFYLPAGRLIIDASKPVAAQSAYTVIVSRQPPSHERQQPRTE
jgi:hypothetical protein